MRRQNGTIIHTERNSQGHLLIPGALSPSEISGELNLPSIKARSWFVCGACAKTGDGLYEAMQHMAKMVKDFRDN